MKKKVFVAFLLIGISFSLFASPADNLYKLIVPTEYSSLSISSKYNSKINKTGVVLFEWQFSSPNPINVALDLESEYKWYKQTLDTDLDINANAELEISNIGFDVDLNTEASFKSYTLNINNLTAFWGTGAEKIDFYASFPFANPSSYTNTLTFDIKPYGEFGINRSYSIFNLKKIETIMKHFNVVPTEQKILDVAKIMYNKNQYINKFSNDNSKLYGEYYDLLAASLAIKNNVASLIYIKNSQEYNFNVSRFIGLRKGWYSAVRFIPGVVKSRTTTYFDGAFKLLGEYSQFIIEDSLHILSKGEVTIGIDGSLTNQFYSTIDVSGLITYLPENYRWWTNAKVSLGLDTAASSLLSLEVDAKINYLINPNFIVWGGTQLDISPGVKKLGVNFGGNIRLF